jgi:hypothetical protein
VPVLFHTGSAHGIRPSELSPPERYPPLSRTEGPTYRSTRRCSRRRSDGPAQTGPGYWALTLPRVPRGQTGVNSLTAGCSLGLHPSRVCRPEPCRAFRPDSSLALPRSPTSRPTSPAPRSIDQLQPGPARSTRQAGQVGGTTLLGFGTSTIRSTRAIHRPGYVFTSCRAARRRRQTSNLWTANLALPELLRTA